MIWLIVSDKMIKLYQRKMQLYACVSVVDVHAIPTLDPYYKAQTVFQLACCALWRTNKVVYAFDETLVSELIQQADEWDDSADLPIQTLLYPPYKCVFIACPDMIDTDLIGFFP